MEASNQLQKQELERNQLSQHLNELDSEIQHDFIPWKMLN